MKNLLWLIFLPSVACSGPLFSMEKVLHDLRLGNPDSEPRKKEYRSQFMFADKDGYTEICRIMKERNSNNNKKIKD